MTLLDVAQRAGVSVATASRVLNGGDRVPRPELQERVKALVEQARERSITTIAERVEDANTMAVLWQLGVEFIQGYFVNSPEEVVLG